MLRTHRSEFMKSLFIGVLKGAHGLAWPLHIPESPSRPHVTVHQLWASPVLKTAVDLSCNRSGKGHQRNQSQKAGPELYGRTRSKGASRQGVNKEAAECHPVPSRLSMAIVIRVSRARGCGNHLPDVLVTSHWP